MIAKNGYHTVVVDPFNSEGYYSSLKGSPALAPKIAESLAYFLNWHQAVTQHKKGSKK
jgi:hypothetical protein